MTICIIYLNFFIYLKIYCKLLFKSLSNKIISCSNCFDKCCICLEPVIFQPKLNLECNCKYTVHYNCYNTWWENNKSCIICRNNTNNRPIINEYSNSINLKKCDQFIDTLAAFTLIIFGHLFLEFCIKI